MLENLHFDIPKSYAVNEKERLIMGYLRKNVGYGCENFV